MSTEGLYAGDAVGVAPLAGLSAQQILEVFSGTGKVTRPNMPRWPNPEIQAKFTGGSGLQLVTRALRLIDALESDGAFAKARWKGLDYGCGWGRVASCMLSKGPADQLDICDAWEASLALAKDVGLENRIFKVSDVLQPGELQEASYDFCYAMSVFTHLDKTAFTANLAGLVNVLVPGGKLYFTVRHESFLNRLKETGRAPKDAGFDETGFWNENLPGKSNFGETALQPRYLDELCHQYGGIDYLGNLEAEQHLYRVVRPSLNHRA